MPTVRLEDGYVDNRYEWVPAPDTGASIQVTSL
jgi:hypothetical protein